ncbi:MAG: NRDE family protein, partial [Gammaproteobacteria bacterium]
QSRRPGSMVESLFMLMADRSVPGDGELPDTGVGIEWERRLAPAFVTAGHYGTRSSTVVILERDGTIHFTERTFDSTGAQTGENEFVIPCRRLTEPQA